LLQAQGGIEALGARSFFPEVDPEPWRVAGRTAFCEVASEFVAVVVEAMVEEDGMNS
jgi:hypothetical protein